MSTTRIDVTKDDLRRGNDTATNCPIARAMKRAGYPRPFVSSIGGVLKDFNDFSPFSGGYLDDDACAFIKAFDQAYQDKELKRQAGLNPAKFKVLPTFAPFTAIITWKKRS